MSKDNFLDDIRSIDDPDMQEVAIFDVNKGEEIYRGTRDDMPSDIKDLEVLSIDTLFLFLVFNMGYHPCSLPQSSTQFPPSW